MFKKCLCILVFVELFCFNSANANEKTAVALQTVTGYGKRAFAPGGKYS